MGVDGRGDLFHRLELCEDFVDHRVHILLTAEYARHRCQQSIELLLQRHDLLQALLNEIWEVQKPQRVTRRRRIEDNGVELHLLDRADELGEGHRLIDSGHRAEDLAHDVFGTLVLGFVLEEFELAEFPAVDFRVDLLRVRYWVPLRRGS